MIVLGVCLLFVKLALCGYYLSGKDKENIKDPPRYFMTDPEPRSADYFEKSHYVEDFKKKIEGQERFVGYTYAGRAEFPWITDVRFEDAEDYEFSSTGNIITRSRVLTSCRIVLYANHYRAQVEERTGLESPEIDGIRWSLQLHQEWVPLNVAYCSNFLWIRYDKLVKGELTAAPIPTEIITEADYEGGQQKVRHIAAHPNCEQDALIYDFAILSLASNIVPLPPTLSFIPVYIDEAVAEITSFDLSNHIHERMLCLVGSFGKPYSNSPLPPTLDYKVKYRAYYANWDECSKIWDLVGAPSSEGVVRPYWCGQFDNKCTINEDDRKELMCFNTRAKVGSVCDHDRGSPIVCDGKVYGFVTRGAEKLFCSNLIHVPFLVVKITAIKDYFTVTDYSLFHMPRTRSTKAPFIERGGRKSKFGEINGATLTYHSHHLPFIVGVMLQLLTMSFQTSMFT